MNATTIDGTTALHAAIVSEKCTQVLVSKNVNINAENEQGNTALHDAVMFGASFDCIFTSTKSNHS